MSEETTVVEETKAVAEITPAENTKVEETPVEGTEPEVKSEETESKAEEVKSEEKVPEKPGRWQKRVNQLTKKVYDLQSQLTAAQQTPMVKPERSGYATDEQYNEALIDFKVDQKIPQVRQQLESGSVAQQFQKAEEAFRAEVEDYDEVIADKIEFPYQSTIDAIVSSDLGPRIRYYLGTHPEETEALLSMNSASASRTIGKIEAKLEAEIAAKKAPVAKAASNARAPIHPVKTAGAPVKIDPNKLSDAEWFKREQELRKQKFKT